jgi:hypothetical protein
LTIEKKSFTYVNNSGGIVGGSSVVDGVVKGRGGWQGAGSGWLEGGE